MSRRTSLLAVSLLLPLLLAAQALAGPPGAGRDTTEAPLRQTQDEWYVVTLTDPPAAAYEGGIPGLARTRPAPGRRLDPAAPEVAAYRAHVQARQADYRAWLATRSPRAQVERSATLVANALTVRANGTSPRTLAQGPGVATVTASWLYRPTMNVSTDLVGAPAVWSAAGGRVGAGAGVKVGVIDSGIDDTHRFFACKGEIPHKVYASGVAGDTSNVLALDHGTHVAGTVAGCVTELEDGPVTGTISGMAPGAELYDYNVFPGYGAGWVAFGGSAFSHDIVAALEDSVADGMHVVNMSLGGSVQGPHDLLAEAVNATADAGLVVAVAAGNSGPGDSTVDSPGSAVKALTAGASTNPHFVGISVTYDSGAGPTTVGAATGDFAAWEEGPVTAGYTHTSPANGCTTITSDVAGRIALIDRGVCTFSTKIRNAEAAGAVGVLVANNVAGDPVGMAHDGLAFPGIPAAMVGLAEGAAMKPSGVVTVDGSNAQEVVTANADIMAGFSSRGPAPFTGVIKPDLTAPGVNVYSSVFDDGFAMSQGTSMATPHLAGAAALLLAAHPAWSPQDVKSAMVTTARRPVFDHVTGQVATGVLARGGGRLDVAAATAVPATFDPASVSFGVWSGNKAVTVQRTISVRGGSGCAVTVAGGDGLVTANPVTVSSGDTITATLDAGQAPGGDYEGDVVVTCGGTDLRLPWFVRIDRKGRP
jgi:minor extracellular serine protease Vpr